MKKKILIIVLIIIVILISGIFFSKNRIKIYFPKSDLLGLYSGAKGESDVNTIWCGTFQLAWNELINQYGKEIEFENYVQNL